MRIFHGDIMEFIENSKDSRFRASIPLQFADTTPLFRRQPSEGTPIESNPLQNNETVYFVKPLLPNSPESFSPSTPKTVSAQSSPKEKTQITPKDAIQCLRTVVQNRGVIPANASLDTAEKIRQEIIRLNDALAKHRKTQKSLHELVKSSQSVEDLVNFLSLILLFCLLPAICGFWFTQFQWRHPDRD